MAPWPGLPSAHTRPPCRATSRRTSASPPEVLLAVEVAEGGEEPFPVAHIEADPVVLHPDRILAFQLLHAHVNPRLFLRAGRLEGIGQELGEDHLQGPRVPAHQGVCQGSDTVGEVGG
nr:hypothetical protein [Deinococcus sp. YIM 77859]